jgi:hypothetical protein
MSSHTDLGQWEVYMKGRKNELWLMVVPLLVFLLVAGAPLGRMMWSHWIMREDTVSIGFFSDTLAEERAAFQALSMQMKKYPHLKVYKVRSSDQNAAERDFLVYTRDHYGYGTNTPFLVLNNPSATHLHPMGNRSRSNITEAQIHAVAAKSGDWRDL